MPQTALDLSPQQWRAYRPDQAVESHSPDQLRRSERRRQQAWRVARQAARLLRDQYGAVKVAVFGSPVHDDWFTPWSDIDLAAWGIPAERFYGAVAAVTGLSEQGFPVVGIDVDGRKVAALNRGESYVQDYSVHEFGRG